MFVFRKEPCCCVEIITFKKTTFDLIIGKIVLEQGAWIELKVLFVQEWFAKAILCLPWVDVATHNLDEYTIYQGNPAIAIRKRALSNL